MESEPSTKTEINPTIRPLREDELPAADHIMRLAFGTFIGLPEPTAFMGDANFVRTRWRSNPEAAFAAEVQGDLAGSNFASNWGSVGVVGPLTVRPDFWDRGIGRRLMEPVVECFTRWGIRHAGLFTFAQSPKHVALYQKFGFWPRFVTALMSKSVDPRQAAPEWTNFSAADAGVRAAILGDCAAITDTIFEGLDLRGEISAVADQQLGDTVLLGNGSGLAGFAICHCGPGTEAGSGTCYIKFGAVRPGPASGADFERLLAACEALAATRSLARLAAGANAGRPEGWRRMLDYGFRTDMQGVAMHRPNEAGYNHPGVYVMDDWR